MLCLIGVVLYIYETSGAYNQEMQQCSSYIQKNPRLESTISRNPQYPKTFAGVNKTEGVSLA